MDVFLSADAQRTLQALSVLSAAKSASGLLLGHKRAGRFFVEAAFPAPAGFRPGPGNFFVLNETFQGRIIGFFLFDGGPAARRAYLQPLACGRCLVAVTRRKSRDIACRAFVVDYDGRFRLDPITVISEGKNAPEGRRIRTRGLASPVPRHKPPLPRKASKDKAR